MNETYDSAPRASGLQSAGQQAAPAVCNERFWFQDIGRNQAAACELMRLRMLPLRFLGLESCKVFEESLFAAAALSQVLLNCGKTGPGCIRRYRANPDICCAE